MGVLLICSMSLLIVGIDVTIVNVALPSIGHDFHASLSGLQWTVDAYTLVLASLLMISGSTADRFGRRRTFVIGLILSSAFSAIVVFAQELVPGKVGMVSGLFFGLAFGVGGIGAAALGALADSWGIERVYDLCSYLPAFGLFAGLLPNIERRAAAAP